MSERENKKTDPRVLRCDEWEDMLADALDEVLPAAEAAAFDRDVAKVVGPFAANGWLDLPVTARFTWGRVNAG